MCKQKMLRTFSLHMVPKGVPPLDTPTATPSGSPTARCFQENGEQRPLTY